MRSSLRTVLSAFVLTRVVLVVSGLATLAWVPPDEASRAPQFRHERPAGAPVLDMWARWDAEWYLDIAERGYRPAPPGGPYWMQPNFFPLYPLTVRAVARITRSGVAAGVLVSNAALVVALWLLHAWTWRHASRATADRLVWIYCCFPTSFFLSAVYAESLLLALLAASWWYEERGPREASGIALALALLTRPPGAFATPPLAGRVLVAMRRGETGRRDVAAILVPPALATLGYLAFAHVTFGDALATVVTQTDSRGPTTWPWLAFLRFWEEGPSWHGWANSILDATVAAGALATLPFVWSRLGIAEAVFAAAVVVFPLGSGLISFSRLVLPAFPVFVVLAMALSRWPYRAWLVGSLALQVWLFWMYIGWRWVA